jgi:hypothetical protein
MARELTPLDAVMSLEEKRHVIRRSIHLQGIFGSVGRQDTYTI